MLNNLFHIFIYKFQPKAFIHWVDAKSSVDGEIRLFSALFTVKDPDAHPGGYLKAANQNSLTVKKAKLEKSLKTGKKFEQFQFERVGFFAFDRDSTDKMPVYNLTIGLKEDKGKN